MHEVIDRLEGQLDARVTGHVANVDGVRVWLVCASWRHDGLEWRCDEEDIDAVRRAITSYSFDDLDDFVDLPVNSDARSA
jgi:hypothetical protein